MNKTDLIIIGAGPGGYRAAEYAAKQGLKVVIFEGSEVGGTCLNVGCIPTKTYVHSTTFEEARERMAAVVSQLRQGVEGILSHPNITLVREKGVFTDAHTVGDYTADNIIIATGSETKWLPIKGKDDPRVVDSTGLLSLENQPKRLAIIGAGVIGMEFASVFNQFGSEVTVIEFLKECLPALDSDIAKRLRKYLEKRGVTFKMKTAVENIADIDADVVLMATGRKPRVQTDFANVGIEYDERKGVTVDENFKTTVNGIYAIGDVNGKQMLAHAAEMQAIHAVNHILGKKDNIRFDVMPAAIFTTPEAACVGPTEDQLKEQGIAYECKKAFWRANGKALAMGETEGMLKLFVSSPSQGGDGGVSFILGCHAYGAHSADIIQEVSVLMCKNTTIKELRDMVHIHPTLGEILLAAAEQ
ncbi:NAD(P)/FAD-dependent oxidoreductase [Prevotella sp. E2-28]|uniref:dihydrolipoyl dehydrogenase family protein n=1 Tax=Prevotella sp. E2-28 TaxID=2913620 RepID=UPI001EDB6EC6|nr:NAD(P)/FAD-dependent oxidoreductase [Prevotella sp. E2-28]UKK53253.1 NAD(P)/FAD-dependent oxidoreductase [Prevotella sp. E2-28]